MINHYLKPVLTISCLLILGCSEKEITPIQLAQDIVSSYENKNSISYDIDYRIKFFSETSDTNKVISRIDLIRAPSDSIFGGYIWIKSDSIERYYNTQFLYLINHNKKEITRFPKEKPYALSGNIINEAARIYFLDPKRLIEGISDSTIVTKLNTDEISKNKTWKLRFDFADNEEINNSWKNIWISKEDYKIHKITYSADSYGENQYNQWNISNSSFNNLEINDLENRLTKLTNSYVVSDFKEEPINKNESLVNGTKFPYFKGMTYPNNESVNQSDFNDKLTLYDFWYMDCPPCLKSIPHLNELHEKYQNKGLKIVGINPINNNKKDLDRLPNFLDHHKINYPIVFIDREKTKEYKLSGYPTFFLTDNSGTILHSEFGFSEDNIEEFEKGIEEYLKK